MILSVYTDGGARGNPGPAAIGIIILKDGNELWSHSEYIGETTNNDAEYQAVLSALVKLKDQKSQELQMSQIQFFSDSELMVRQLNGLYKIKNERIRNHVSTIRSLEAEIAVPINYAHIPRAQNSKADALVNNALNARALS